MANLRRKEYSRETKIFSPYLNKADTIQLLEAAIRCLNVVRLRVDVTGALENIQGAIKCMEEEAYD